MSAYVDPLSDRGWRLGPNCHLIADTPAELHEFAARLGLRRSWYQGDASTPHYDLTVGRRNRALQLGAIELPPREFIKRCIVFRAACKGRQGG